MPKTLYANSDRTLLYARCYGNLTHQDVINWDVENKVLEQPEKGFLILIDFSDISGTDMTFDDINAIYGKLSRYYGTQSQKVSFILSAPNDLAFGMARILETLAGANDHIDVQILKSSAELLSPLPGFEYSFHLLRIMAQTESPDLIKFAS